MAQVRRGGPPQWVETSGVQRKSGGGPATRLNKLVLGSPAPQPPEGRIRIAWGAMLAAFPCQAVTLQSRPEQLAGLVATTALSVSRCLARSEELQLPHLVAFSRLSLARFHLLHPQATEGAGDAGKPARMLAMGRTWASLHCIGSQPPSLVGSLPVQRGLWAVCAAGAAWGLVMPTKCF